MRTAVAEVNRTPQSGSRGRPPIFERDLCVAFLIAFEGIDGSGKGTQARRLYDRLLESGARAALLSFPRYEATLFGRAIGQFLNGRFGKLDEVNPFLVSLLYAGDRFESRRVLEEVRAAQDVVVLDRYVPSNIAHQCAKLPAAEQQELRNWIQQIEYGIYELPRPDVVLLLDLPVAQAQDLIAQKARRSYTDKAADLQEADSRYLERVRNAYQALAETEPNWRVVDCLSSNAGVRGIDEIADEIWDIVQTLRPR